MPALMELVDHMGPLRLMQPAGPVESVDSSNLQQTLDQSTMDIVTTPLLRQTKFWLLVFEAFCGTATYSLFPFSYLI